MAHYYIVDSTIKNNGKNPVLLFNSIDSVVHHLEAMCQRHFKQDRKTFMNNVESLGFGADEQTGRAFYDQMEQYFNVGGLYLEIILRDFLYFGKVAVPHSKHKVIVYLKINLVNGL